MSNSHIIFSSSPYQRTDDGFDKLSNRLKSLIIDSDNWKDELKTALEKLEYDDPEAHHQLIKREAPGLYLLYYLHGWFGLLIQVPYAYFTYSFNKKGFIDIVKAGSHGKKELSPLLNDCLSAPLTGFSFLGSITFAPEVLARKAIKDSLLNPEKGFLNQMRKHKILTIAMIFHFLVGGYSGVDQAYDLMDQYLGEAGKDVMIAAILYSALSYYFLFNGIDVFKGYENYRQQNLLKQSFRHEPVTVTYTLFQEQVTVFHRSINYFYYAYKAGVQNKASTTVANGLGIAAFFTTYAVALLTRGNACRKKFFNPDIGDNDFKAAQEIYEAEYKKKNCLEKLTDAVSRYIFSPAIFLALPASYFAFTLITHDSSDPSPAQLVGGALAGTTTFVVTELFYRAPSIKKDINELALKLKAENAALSPTTAPVAKPNRAATLLGFASNFSDQFSRILSTDPIVLAFITLLTLSDNTDPSIELVLTAFSMGAFISVPNFNYQWPKNRDALAGLFPTLFAKKARQTNDRPLENKLNEIANDCQPPEEKEEKLKNRKLCIIL